MNIPKIGPKKEDNVSKPLKIVGWLNIESQNVEIINANIEITDPALFNVSEFGIKLIKVFCEGI